MRISDWSSDVCSSDLLLLLLLLFGPCLRSVHCFLVAEYVTIHCATLSGAYKQTKTHVMCTSSLLLLQINTNTICYDEFTHSQNFPAAAANADRKSVV